MILSRVHPENENNSLYSLTFPTPCTSVHFLFLEILISLLWQSFCTFFLHMQCSSFPYSPCSHSIFISELKCHFLKKVLRNFLFYFLYHLTIINSSSHLVIFFNFILFDECIILHSSVSPPKSENVFLPTTQYSVQHEGDPSVLQFDLLW